MKKLLSLVLAALMMLTLFAGCQSDDPSPSDPGGTENPDNTPDNTPGGGDELNLAIFEGGFGPDFWNMVGDLFEAETGIKVNLQISPTIADIVRPQIVGGNPPDFVNFQTTAADGLMATMVKERSLMDLTDLFNGPQFDSDAPLKDKIIDGFLESNACAPYGDGKIFHAPAGMGPMGPIYNAALFNEKGWNVPVTWDEYFALGDKAAAEGIALQTYQGSHPSYFESMLLPALASALGSDFSKIENFEPGIWTDPRTIAVLEQFEKIYTGDYLLKGTTGLNFTQAQTAQMMDEALFIPCGTWMEGEMADSPRADSYQFGLTPPPVMNSGDTRYVASWVEQFSIPAGAKNAENAKRFMRFMYTDKIIKLYAEYNGGAVLATKNGLDMAKSYISEDTYSMYEVFNMPGAAALIIAFAAPPEGTTIVYSNEIYNPITDLMSGKITARQWAESMDKAYQDMADGK